MWTRELTQKLIEKYERFLELWDVSSAHYKNKVKKESAFTNIAADLKLEPNEIRKKLHNLRTQFLQEIRRVKQKKSGQGIEDNYKSKWEFFDSLKFIIAQQEDNSYNLENLNKSQEENEPMAASSEVMLSKPPFKKKRTNASVSEDDLLLQKAASVMDRPQDDHQIFGDYVALEFRLLKSDTSRIRLRRKIQRAIMEVSEFDAEEDFPNSSWVRCSHTSKRCTLTTPVEASIDDMNESQLLGTYIELDNTPE